MLFKTYFLVGGAGFIGSHFIDALLKQNTTQKVTVFDNFSSGKEWHYQHHLKDPRLTIIKGDVKDTFLLNQSIEDHDVVMHFASNPDIALAINNPSIDFTEGFFLTYQVLEAMRLARTKRLIYFSGSGVYGDLGEKVCYENQGSLHPISTYGASKLAGEAFISSYCHMFGLTACIFRFANVVGPRQTHGVGYDFIKKLLRNKTSLSILGDGTQSKSYIHVDDVISAVFLANEKLSQLFEIYNIATGDYITVTEIANIVVDCMGLKNQVEFIYRGGDRGWNGDVPIIRMNTDKINALGWKCQRTAENAFRESVNAMIEHLKISDMVS